MNIPQDLQLKLVLSAHGDNGHWLQHLRDDANHLGVITRRAGRGTHILQTYYADYILNTSFPDVHALRDAAKAIDSAYAQQVLAQYPFLWGQEPLNLKPGQQPPNCSVYGEHATHVATLVCGWQELCNPTVYLSSRALKQLHQPDHGAQWLKGILDARGDNRS